MLHKVMFEPYAYLLYASSLTTLDLQSLVDRSTEVTVQLFYSVCMYGLW